MTTIQGKGFSFWADVIAADQRNMIWKPLAAAANWAKVIKPGIENAYRWIDPLARSGRIMVGGITVGDLPHSLCRFGNQLAALREGKVRQFVIEGASLVSAVCFGIDTANLTGICVLKDALLQRAARCSAIALLIISANGAIEEILRLPRCQYGSKKMVYSAINFSKWISYLSLSSCALRFSVSMVVPCMILPWMPLAFSTSALFFTNVGTVYKNLYKEVLDEVKN
jgi:hypothetical protein